MRVDAATAPGTLVLLTTEEHRQIFQFKPEIQSVVIRFWNHDAINDDERNICGLIKFVHLQYESKAHHSLVGCRQHTLPGKAHSNWRR